MFTTEINYVCEKTQADKKPCKFRSGKVILGQPIDGTQMTKLLETGRSDLLDKFISKTGRPFSAWLVVDDAGKVGFEFPPRESEAPQGKTALTARKDSGRTGEVEGNG